MLVCSYGLLHQEAELLAGRRLADGGAGRGAGHQERGDQAARRRAIALQAGFRLALTGTPVENHLDELWSLFSFVNPGLLGSREEIPEALRRPDRARTATPTARAALRALVRPFLLRRTKAAVLSELPPRTEQTVTVEMERGGARLLRGAAPARRWTASPRWMRPRGRRKIHILAEITRLRRACCNPALVDPSWAVPGGKLAAFLDLVEELVRNRHKALVFSQFVGHLDLVRAALDAARHRYAVSRRQHAGCRAQAPGRGVPGRRGASCS